MKSIVYKIKNIFSNNKNFLYIGIYIFSTIIFSILLSIYSYRQVSKNECENIQKIVQAKAETLSNNLSKYKNITKTIASLDIIDFSEPEKTISFLTLKANTLGINYTEIFIVDKDGNFYSSNGKKLNISNREYFKDLINTEKNYLMSDPIKSKTMNQDSVIFASAVYKDKIKNGIVGFLVSIAEIRNIVKEFKIDKNEIQFLVDGNGYVIAQMDIKLEQKMNIHSASVFGFYGFEEVADSIMSGKTQANTIKASDNNKYYVFSVGINETPNWCMCYAVAEEFIHSQNIIYQTFIYVYIFLFILATYIFCVSLGRYISKRMNTILDFSKQFSLGKLDNKIPLMQSKQKDVFNELSRLLNYTEEKIGNILSNIQDVSHDVLCEAERLAENAKESAKGISTISSSNQILSQGSEAQAKSIEEISHNVKIMNIKTSENAQNAYQAARIANDVVVVAKMSSDADKRTIKAVKEIIDKIGFIKEIATQTNLLSMNANIEASRTKDNANGFAFIADEVGKLAERCQSEVREITELSKKCIDTTLEAGTLSTTSIERITSMANLVHEISDACSEQNINTEYIKQSITSLDKVILQNAALAEEMSTVSYEISEQSSSVIGTTSKLVAQMNKLNDVVSFFDLTKKDYTDSEKNEIFYDIENNDFEEKIELMNRRSEEQDET